MDYPYLFKLEKAFGFLSILWLAAIFSDKFQFGKLVTGSTFILFAIHSDILKVIIKIFFKITPWHTDVFYTLAYFVIATVAILMSVYIYGILSRFLPRLCNLISGGR